MVDVKTELTTVTPQQQQRLAEGMADLLRLRAADPNPLAREHSPCRASSADQAPETNVPEVEGTHLDVRRFASWPGVRLVHGDEREDLLTWLFTYQASRKERGAPLRRAIDDVTRDDTPSKFLRVLREEGFTEAARVPDYRGDDLRLLTHPDGWLAQVEITTRGGRASAWAWLSINAIAVDHELVFAGPSWKYAHKFEEHNPLIYGTALVNGTGLRVLCALLRAATLPVNPWQTPAVRDWLGGEPPLVPNDPGGLSVSQSVAATTAVLNSLPAATRTLIEPDLRARESRARSAS
ncbi:MAG: hypothetical protein QOF58_1935 [Pseudonocardiales bacterium]|nr:hypothetical protein [Pseudonocardiales bacterium]